MALRFLNSGYFAGKVGIGTESPSAPLEIAGVASATDTGITIKNGSATRLRLFHNDNAGASYLTTYRGVQAAQRLIIESGNDLYFSGGGGSANMVIKTSGNVGIGTTTPNAKLDIQGTQGQLFSVTDDLSGEIFAVADISGVPIMTVNSSGVSYFDGKVGIGTNSPDNELHIYKEGNAFIKVDSGATSPYMAGVEFLRSSINGGRIYNDGGAVQVKLESYYGYESANPTRGGFTFKTAPVTSGTLVDAVRINALGNVGIGTNSPSTKLHVEGLTRITEGGNTAFYSGNYVRLFNSQAYQFRNTGGSVVANINLSGDSYFNGGNVGIGTTGPAYKLDVSGGVRSTHFRDGLQGNGTTSTTAGWYKVASWTGGSARGGSEIKLSTTGGTFTPITWIIRCFKNWSYDATLKLEQYGYSNIWFTKARIVRDTTTNILYVEIYQPGTTAITVQMYQTSLMGYDANVTMVTGTLAAGTTTANESVRAELPFIAGGTSVEALTIGTSGNTGPYLPLAGGTMTGALVGTSASFNSTLNVQGVTTLANVGYLGDGLGSVQYILKSANNGYATIDFGDVADSNIGRLSYSHVDNSFLIRTNNATALTLDSSQNAIFTGNVGIGTTNPGYKLSVDDNSVTNIPKTLLQFDAASIADNGGYNIDFRTSSNDTADRYVARIRGIRESTGALSQLSFWTESGAALEQRMTIRASGNVGIGTTTPGEKLEVNGNIKIQSALLSNQANTNIDTGAEVVAQVSTSLYTAAFFDFVIKKVGNIRSGTVYACHDGTNVEFTETSTQDLGDTSDVVLSVDKSGTNMRLIATVASDDWIVKSLIRAI